MKKVLHSTQASSRLCSRRCPCLVQLKMYYIVCKKVARQLGLTRVYVDHRLHERGDSDAFARCRTPGVITGAFIKVLAD